jgi:hypothetical protein
MKIFACKADPSTPHETVTPDRIIEITRKIDDDFNPAMEGEEIAEALWAALPGATCDRLLEAMLRRRGSQLRVSRSVFDPTPDTGAQAGSVAVAYGEPAHLVDALVASTNIDRDELVGHPRMGDAVRIVEGARYGMVGRLDGIVSSVRSTLFRVELLLPGRPLVFTDSVAHSYVADESAIGRHVTVTGSDWNGTTGKLVALFRGQVFRVNVNGILMLTTRVSVVGRGSVAAGPR